MTHILLNWPGFICIVSISIYLFLHFTLYYTLSIITTYSLKRLTLWAVEVPGDVLYLTIFIAANLTLHLFTSSLSLILNFLALQNIFILCGRTVWKHFLKLSFGWNNFEASLQTTKFHCVLTYGGFSKTFLKKLFFSPLKEYCKKKNGTDCTHFHLDFRQKS